jgi:2-oxoisovalerate dehydrogenase E1 component alpha subunit
MYMVRQEDVAVTNEYARVLFPGALNSEFTDKLDFIQPSQQKAIPTYRVMNQYGEIIDKEVGVETEDEEALQIYKNMVKCRYNHTSQTWAEC